MDLYIRREHWHKPCGPACVHPDHFQNYLLTQARAAWYADRRDAARRPWRILGWYDVYHSYKHPLPMGVFTG